MTDLNLTTDQLERAKKRLDSMPTNVRSVFLLHMVDKLGYSAIAERLGMSRKKVEHRLAKAFEICARHAECEEKRDASAAK